MLLWCRRSRGVCLSVDFDHMLSVFDRPVLTSRVSLSLLCCSVSFHLYQRREILILMSTEFLVQISIFLS